MNCVERQKAEREAIKKKYGRASLHLNVMERYLDEKTIKEMVHEYKKHSSGWGAYVPSDEDFKCYGLWVADKITLAEACERMGATINTVYARFAKITKQQAK